MARDRYQVTPQSQSTYSNGKFKTKRGGGRSFSKNLELNEDGIAVGRPRKPQGEDIKEEDGSSEEGESSSEESDDDDGGGGGEAPSAEMANLNLSRADRKALKKQGKAKAEEAPGEDDDLINPNHSSAKTKKISEIGNAPPPLSRREREEKEKKEAKERYWKLHQEGKTDQAKSDMARLAAIRKEREEAAAKRKAEQEAKKAEMDAKVAAQKKR